MRAHREYQSGAHRVFQGYEVMCVAFLVLCLLAAWTKPLAGPLSMQNGSNEAVMPNGWVEYDYDR